MKAAQSLGLTISPTLLAQADEVVAVLLHLLAAGMGTELPIPNVRFFGRYGG
jgi:hypothetical protein